MTHSVIHTINVELPNLGCKTTNYLLFAFQSEHHACYARAFHFLFAFPKGEHRACCIRKSVPASET